MADQSKFLAAVQTGYQFKGDHVKIGRGMLNGEVVADADIFLPLKTMNRHSCVAFFQNDEKG